MSITILLFTAYLQTHKLNGRSIIPREQEDTLKNSEKYLRPNHKISQYTK